MENEIIKVQPNGNYEIPLIKQVIECHEIATFRFWKIRDIDTTIKEDSESSDLRNQR